MPKDKKKETGHPGRLARMYGGTVVGTSLLQGGAYRHVSSKGKNSIPVNPRVLKTLAKEKKFKSFTKQLWKQSKGAIYKPSFYRTLKHTNVGDLISIQGNKAFFGHVRAARSGIAKGVLTSAGIGAGIYAYGKYKGRQKK